MEESGNRANHEMPSQKCGISPTQFIHSKLCRVQSYPSICLYYRVAYRLQLPGPSWTVSLPSVIAT